MEGPKLKRNMEGTGTKPTQIPKRRRSCTHKRHPRQSECWSRKQLAFRENKPSGSSDFVVAALFTFVMYGLMLREIF